MKRAFICLILAMTGVMSSGGSAYAEEPVVIAINIVPPYIFQKDGVLTGFIPEITGIVAKKAGLPYVMNVYPWTRVYQMGLEDENILMPAIFRTPERENLFKWVGMILPLKLWMFKLKRRADIHIDSIEAAKTYQVGGGNKDATTQHLIRQGFIRGKNLTVVTGEEQLVKMLNSGRVDLIVSEELVFQYWVKASGLNPSDFEKAYSLDDSYAQLSFAFSQHTNDAIVGKYKKALNEIKEDGTFEKVFRKWGL